MVHGHSYTANTQSAREVSTAQALTGGPPSAQLEDAPKPKANRSVPDDRGGFVDGGYRGRNIKLTLQSCRLQVCRLLQVCSAALRIVIMAVRCPNGVTSSMQNGGK